MNWKNLIGLVCLMSVLGFSINRAYGTYVNKQLGAMVETIIDPIPLIVPCPQGDEQLVVENINSSGGPVANQAWTEIDCIDNQCVVSYDVNYSSVLTVCPDGGGVGASSCVPSTILSTQNNAYHYDPITDVFVSGISVTLSAGVGSMTECTDPLGICFHTSAVLAVPEYDSFYFSKNGPDTFAPKDISICRIGTDFPATTPECLSVSGGTNDVYDPIAVDPTTNSLYFHYNSFGSTVRKYALSGSGNLISAGITNPVALPFTWITSDHLDVLTVKHGGDIYLGRWNGGVGYIVRLKQSDLSQVSTFPAGAGNLSGRLQSVWYDNNNGALYTCGGNTVNPAEITIAKLSDIGTVLASNTLVNVGNCLRVRVSPTSGLVYMTNISGRLLQLNSTTLVVEATVPLGNTGLRNTSLSIDDRNRKVYISSDAPNGFNTNGDIYKISTCST